MIVDASALIAIVKGEEDAALFEDALAEADRVAIGAPTLVEARLVLTSLGERGLAALGRVLEIAGVEVVAFDERHAARAHEAHRLYGRGSGHPARLNYGDCLAYAVASVEQRPLLFKGDDFSHTDLTPVIR